MTDTIETYSAKWLLEQEFQAPGWIVQDLLPEGLGLLVGRSKSGKSWLALGMAAAVANGGTALGHRDAVPGEVLYADLEQPPRRTQKRLERVLTYQSKPNDLYFANDWPALDQGALDSLRDWLDRHHRARLVVVDTVAKVWPAKMGGPGINAYYAEYQLLAQFKELADERGICLLLLHHRNKSNQEDPLDSVSGTAAIVGVPDAILILDRKRNGDDSKLIVTGRDVRDQELSIHFDHHIGNWTITGDGGGGDDW